MRQTTCIILVLACFFVSAFTQDRKIFKKTFLDAEYCMMTEEYKEAIGLYLELLVMDPDNTNLHFLLGACYLSFYGEKEKAIPYLEKAVQSISTGYREGSYKERGAPREALFALARAYHIIEEFDWAIEQYEAYKNVMIKRNFADIEFVNHQIKSCELARTMIKKPVEVRFLKMDPAINRFSDQYHPTVSWNDSVIIYLADQPRQRAIMVSKLGGEGWSKPREINRELGSEGDCYPVCLSRDGKELYLVRKNYPESDIYLSRLVQEKWTVMEKLNPNINTRYDETHASLSLDGKMLLFTSNRPGGQGALDIWMSEREADGEWQEAVNMGPVINSFYNEETPFLSENGRKLYFSSQGHATMGGFDIFVCKKKADGTWSLPENLGYPISSADDDLFYVPRSNGRRGYYSARFDSAGAGRNIYSLLFPLQEDIQIAVRNQADRNTVTDAGTEIPPASSGDSEGTLKDTAGAAEKGMAPADSMPGKLVPGPVEPDDYFVLNSLLFDFDSDRMNDAAKVEADRIFKVMQRYPDLELELTGHADAVGDEKYNLELSHRRARRVAGYLVEKGIEASRLHITGVGESNPIALNVYEDGTDCAEGRRLNRHVSLKLMNLQDEKVEVDEIFVPDDLKPPAERRYTILLIQSEDLLDSIPQKVSGEQSALIITDEAFLYTAGNFHLKPDAMIYLNEVIDRGYPDANMLENTELERVIKSLSKGTITVETAFTIQVMALKNPVDVSYFKPLEVLKYAGKDGFHRYIHGEYESIALALEDLPLIREMGYHDAFIMSILRYHPSSE